MNARNPDAHTMTASHTDLQVACATARAALLAWTRAEPRNDGPRRLAAFIEAVHAHDFVASFHVERAQTWRRRLAQAIELEQTHNLTAARMANEARAQAARLAR